MRCRVGFNGSFWFFELNEKQPLNQSEIYLDRVRNKHFGIQLGSIVEIQTSKKTVGYGRVVQIVLNGKVFIQSKIDSPLEIRVAWIYTQAQLRRVGYKDEVASSYVFTNHFQMIDVFCVNGIAKNVMPSATVLLSE